MRDNEGFDILINGVPRTFRDRPAPASDAAYVLKQKHIADVVEVRDRSTGQKVLMREDGRTA
jgi:hypothetical protein